MNIATIAPWQVSQSKLPAMDTVSSSASFDDNAMSRLIDEIRSACLGPVDDLPGRVARSLDQADRLAGHLQALLHGQDGAGYSRHVLHGDPQGRFTVVAIVWQPGQFSPVHAHHTWCAYHVLHGTLSEKQYAWNATMSLANYTHTLVRSAGDSSSGHAGLEQIHSLGNASNEPAISVHVYGIDANRIATHVNRLLSASTH